MEGWLGLASPQCPHQSKEQVGAERRNTLQEQRCGSAWPKPWPSAAADMEALRDKLELSLVAQVTGILRRHCPGSPCPRLLGRGQFSSQRPAMYIHRGNQST